MQKCRHLIIVAALAVMMASTSVQAQLAPGRAGMGGFFVGCCLGLRTGVAWNEGKQLHWREMVRFIPYVGAVIGIWDGIECAQGLTSADLQQRYGSMFY